MDSSKSNNPNVKLLACLVESDDAIDPDDSHYRFLVDGEHVKYVSTAPGALTGDVVDRTFGPVLLGELLPPFPPGNWNKGYVAKDPGTGQVVFTKTEIEIFPGVENLWHTTRLNELDFTRDRVGQRVRMSQHPEINDGQPVLIKTGVWPWEIASIEAETAAYRHIHGKNIGPRFLGHLTEGKDGRVVGFVVEWIQDARSAGPGDFEKCREALGRLHELGMKLGDINKHNFLVREGCDVVLIDFETAKTCSAQELEDEMNNLKQSLADPSFRGGVETIYE